MSAEVARRRFHRGLTAELRQAVRRAGLSLDEESAQFLLAGVNPMRGRPQEILQFAVNDVFGAQHELQTAWEREHPDRNPFPPSFPDRVLRYVRRALEECNAEDGAPVGVLVTLQQMCERELSDDPYTVADPEIDDDL